MKNSSPSRVNQEVAAQMSEYLSALCSLGFIIGSRSTKVFVALAAVVVIFIFPQKMLLLLKLLNSFQMLVPKYPFSDLYYSSQAASHKKKKKGVGILALCCVF